MAYIGKTPQVGNYQKCDALTASATADYTLQVSSTNVVPESLNHMIVSLNGVIQEPGATGGFTVSGSTLSFASALTSNDTIDFVLLLGNVLDIGTPSDGTISNAKLGTDVISGETDIGGAIADADLFLLDDGAGGTLRKTAASRIKTYIGGGITVADQWRVTADFTGENFPIASNWEQVDTGGQGTIGSAMTESSGIFTFPSTGIYEVTFSTTGYWSGENEFTMIQIFGTIDDSAYVNLSESSQGITDASTTIHYHTSVSTLFDVTSTSNCKVQFRVDVEDASTVMKGSSITNETYVTFIRLGDT